MARAGPWHDVHGARLCWQPCALDWNRVSLNSRGTWGLRTQAGTWTCGWLRGPLTVTTKPRVAGATGQPCAGSPGLASLAPTRRSGEGTWDRRVLTPRPGEARMKVAQLRGHQGSGCTPVLAPRTEGRTDGSLGVREETLSRILPAWSPLPGPPLLRPRRVRTTRGPTSQPVRSNSRYPNSEMSCRAPRRPAHTTRTATSSSDSLPRASPGPVAAVAPECACWCEQRVCPLRSAQRQTNSCAPRQRHPQTLSLA